VKTLVEARRNTFKSPKPDTPGITMNQQGAGNLIRQLELFASQLEEDNV
jgi:hypothetical protein